MACQVEEPALVLFEFSLLGLGGATSLNKSQHIESVSSIVRYQSSQNLDDSECDLMVTY